jgi:hypothetical protein
MHCTCTTHVSHSFTADAQTTAVPVSQGTAWCPRPLQLAWGWMCSQCLLFGCCQAEDGMSDELRMLTERHAWQRSEALLAQGRDVHTPERRTHGPHCGRHALVHRQLKAPKPTVLEVRTRCANKWQRIDAMCPPIDFHPAEACQGCHTHAQRAMQCTGKVCGRVKGSPPQPGQVHAPLICAPENRAA